MSAKNLPLKDALQLFGFNVEDGPKTPECSKAPEPAPTPVPVIPVSFTDLLQILS